MKKEKKEKVNKRLAKKLASMKCENYDESLIPAGCYCDGCPYKKYIKIRYKKFMKYQLATDKGFGSILVPSGWKRAEYCSVLGDFLSIQDSIKDCDINDEME